MRGRSRGGWCEIGQIQCTIAEAVDVDPETYAKACAALGVPGIDAVWCVLQFP